MSENSIPSFEEALKVLEDFSSSSLTQSFYVPSLKRDVQIKEISAKQQKQLLNVIVDTASSVYKTQFNKTFFSMLIENCSEDEETIQNFTIFDRFFLSLNMRNQIDSQLSVEFSNETEKYTEVLNLSELIQQFKKYNHPDTKNITIERAGTLIEIDLRIPTLKIEAEFEEKLPVFKNSNPEIEDIKNLLTHTYIGESAKYIENITISGKNLNFKNLKIDQKLNLLEKLPAVVLQKILTNVVLWKQEVDGYLTVASTRGDTKILDIDANLFLSA